MSNSISEISETNNDMSFVINGTDSSIVNAIRRTILSEIPILGFKTTPHEENKCEITTNTSRFNNEIIKQRLSCIPVHISDLSIPYENLEVSLNVKNNTSNLLMVTTEDFKIMDTTNDTYVSSQEVKKIFPPNKITKDYILFLRLRPKLSETLKEEEINLTAKLSLVTAKENGCYNAVSICTFNNLPNTVKIQEAWNTKSAELASTGMTETEISVYKQNWLLLDAKRIYLEDAFKFKIKSIGIYKCTDIVKMACDILVKQLETISAGNGFAVKDNETTMENSIDVLFENEDYAIGKLLEYMFYTNYYMNTETITYVSFYKSHPHNTESILRLSFKNKTEKTAISYILSTVSNECIEVFKNIRLQF